MKKELIIALQSSPIIYIPHYDYEMIDEYLYDAIKELQPAKPQDSILEYDLYTGWVFFNTKTRHSHTKNGKEVADNKMFNDFYGLLRKIIDSDDFDVERTFLCKNIRENILQDEKTQALLQTFVAKYKHGDYNGKGSVYSIVIISPMPVSMLPDGIREIVTVVECPIPTESEIKVEIEKYPVSRSVERGGSDVVNEFRQALTNSMLGLQMYEIRQIMKTVQKRNEFEAGGVQSGLTKKAMEWVLQEKQNIVKKSGIIELIPSDVTLNDIGGLDRLKKDIKNKAVIYKHLNDVERLMNKSLPLPKGVLILGMPGSGKSMMAKAIASEFGVSLLRLDVNRLMGQYVGMSEENLRKALQTAEIANPCVLWIDEVEKAFAGAGSGSGGGEGDMLVQRLMGQFLTWMQERKSAVYVVATANDVMRSEFMRKGRFDEVYFVDFPCLNERKEILKAKLRKYGYGNEKIKSPVYDLSAINDSMIDTIAKEMLACDEKGKKRNEETDDHYSNGFSGAEIESVVNQVMEKAYVDYQIAVEQKMKPLPAKIIIENFSAVVKDMASSVMANQVTSKEEKDKNPLRRTNIERIRELEKNYKFIHASESKRNENNGK